MTTNRPTVAAATKAHPLASAVLRQLGGGADAVAYAIEAGEHGADAGWSGFTYYADTIAFAKRHRAAILDSIRADADDMGEQYPHRFVAGFKCLSEVIDAESLASIALYGGKCRKENEDDFDLVLNALAWYALETVGRAIADLAD